MRITAIMFLLFCIGATACLAGTDPTVTAQVNIVGDFKDYVYVLTNDADSAAPIAGFAVFMPESAARAVLSFTASKLNWYDTRSMRGDNSFWAMGAFEGAQVLVGDQVTFTLRTPASLPTSYSYQAGGHDYNWQWNSIRGGSLLPVPAPEPSSILALAGGIAGFGGLALRRRLL